ncbi:NCS2 family permease [Salininema proteolyticum]|uniref:NCS2 family permease n=1 Tax=Salininema proteolyticum TaxID=1607685 RepID=A0ABV8TV81_9ACTN
MTATEPEQKTRPRGVDRFFGLTSRGTTVPRELRAGLTTFMSMAQIIILNPLILSGAADVNGEYLSHSALTTMTALSAGLATIVMGLVGRVPLALATALSVTAVLTYQVVPQVTWAQAMGLIVIEGLIVFVLALTGVRTKIMNAIPKDLRFGITMGLGMFLSLIGLVHAGFVTRRPDSAGTEVPVQLGHDGVLGGWPIAVFVIGLIIMISLFVRHVPGAMVIAILSATVAAIVGSSLAEPEEWGLVEPTVPSSVTSLPDFSLLGSADPIGAITGIGVLTLLLLTFTLLLSGFFDAMGAIMACGHDAGMTDENGKVRNLRRLLSVDGAAHAFGGLTSSGANAVYVESVTGVHDGARTGLASLMAGGMFLGTMFFTPVVELVPQQAAAPALVLVGSLMIMQAKNIDWGDFEITIPTFLIVALIPFTYSVTAGVSAGVIAYVVIKAVKGKWREPGLFLWGLSVVCALYFVLPMMGA